MRELYCTKCRMSFTALRTQCDYGVLEYCKGGGAHHFTEEKLPELIPANHEGIEKVQ
jgi:hypothetical protein